MPHTFTLALLYGAMAKKTTARINVLPWPGRKAIRFRQSAGFLDARGRSTRWPQTFGLRAYEAVAKAGFEFAQVLADQSDIRMEPSGVLHTVLPHFGHDGIFHVVPSL
jgi:hypothetical protein